jgi:rhodanese-related sulfurtransferase/rubrerythrin
MGIMDYFKQVSTWPAQKVREFLQERDYGEYNLVDVRQPREYENGHLPGATLIPVGQLAERLDELDPARPTITYCAAGVRSRAAASVLERAGFKEVHSMAGGINAWQGLVAEGFPEAGIAWFAEARSTDELMALAWILEEGTKTFYDKIAGAATDPSSALLFRELAKDEERHEEVLSDLYRDIRGAVGGIDFPSLLDGYHQEKIMEGGMRLDDALAWAEGRNTKDILELSISLETGSYDRYLIMQEKTTGEQSLKIFKSLAGEEKRHLQKLVELFEKNLGP